MLFGVFISDVCKYVGSARDVCVRLGVHVQDYESVLSINPESVPRLLQVSAEFYGALHDIENISVARITDSEIAGSALPHDVADLASESMKVLLGTPKSVSFHVLPHEETMRLGFVDGVADALAYTSDKFSEFLRDWDGSHAYQMYVNEEDEGLLPSQLSDEGREDAVIRLGNTVVEAFQSLITRFAGSRLSVETTYKNGVFSVNVVDGSK